MKFEIVGASGICVEEAGFRLLIDPWFEGPCYWGSWWPTPSSVAPSAEALRPDAIVLTSPRPENTHDATLRRFESTTPIYLPKFPTSQLERRLRLLGFTDLHPIPHGKQRHLADGLSIASFQSGWSADSSLVVQAGGQRLLLADSHQVDGMDNLRSRFGESDILIGSTTPHSGYPDCYKTVASGELHGSSRRRRVQHFYEIARRTGAKIAIPRGVGHCYLHRESFDRNDHRISGSVIQAWKPATAHALDLQILPSGSRYDSRSGFDIRSAANDIDDQAGLYSLRESLHRELEAQDALERSFELQWETFERAMGRFLRKLPLALRLVFEARVAYQVREEGQRCWWILDFGRRRIERTLTRPLDAVSVTTVDPGLLQLALEENAVSRLESSKRPRIEVASGGAADHLFAHELLALYEEGQFPLLQNETRFVATWTRRHAQLRAYAKRKLAQRSQPN